MAEHEAPARETGAREMLTQLLARQELPVAEDAFADLRRWIFASVTAVLSRTPSPHFAGPNSWACTAPGHLTTSAGFLR